jgi:hypothetical protein
MTQSTDDERELRPQEDEQELTTCPHCGGADLLLFASGIGLIAVAGAADVY